MKTATTLALTAILAGCAAQPMTPEEQQAFQRAMENIRTQRVPYEVIQPQPQPLPAQRAPMTCRTYRNIGGQIQTDCN